MKKFLSLICVLFFVFVPLFSSAHVRYLAEDQDVAELSGADFTLLSEPLTQTNNIALILVTIAVFFGVYFILARLPFFIHWANRTREVTKTYHLFIPWIARLSLGIALIGAGAHDTLISPVITGTPVLSIVQIALGFFLMAGFLVGPTAIVVLLLFIAAIAQDSYLLGSLDFLALIFVLLIFDARRPGVDDIVGIPDFAQIKELQIYLPTILRVGIGTSMIYLALWEKILNPNLSLHVVEIASLTSIVPVSGMMWVFSMGVIELLIGILLVIGWKTRLTAVVTLIVLSLSFFYFGEDVASHITLFGILSLVFILGAGPFAIDKSEVE